ncbi:GNAT family N-acetyltransferase [Sphaerotilus uruguayifluvii]|uniref:BioF2-like acetyltransferase domain-containing protein n=1 Tax=Sphaerotilus uruguayifluvii TaxID=2735897 RepID=A0ABX2FZC6_9BURK|nr:GNAT family N-acetyltransferase [Leptothrix sp. C29]NRT55337.1 hypothetical protein [Leptothrix sp. C29]
MNVSAPAPLASATELAVSVVRDTDGLTALRTDWEMLERRAVHGSPFVRWRHVQLAARHLLGAGDELHVMTVRADDERLVGVLPLLRTSERHYGMTLKVLRQIGILEGDRPGVLALDDADAVWAALWRHLKANRADWQVLDLRELEPDCWPLRELAEPGAGFHAEVHDDVLSTFQRLDGSWNAHLTRRPETLREQRLQARQQLAAAMPRLCVAVADTPQDILAAFDRYLALEAGLREQDNGVTIGGDERRVAFYRDWLPRLAADGDAAVWLLGSVEQGEAAGLLRLRSGHVWIERHACFDPARAAQTPSLLLLLEALQHGFGTTATESRLVNLREPQPAAASVMSWYDDCIQTQRLSVWNLHSKLAPVAFLKGLGRRLRG